jgi:hypothetical protein
MLPPTTVHDGRVEQNLTMRRQALALAFNAHPGRFRDHMPVLEGPKEVWINRPDAIPGLIHPTKLTKL